MTVGMTVVILALALTCFLAGGVAGFLFRSSEVDGYHKQVLSLFDQIDRQNLRWQKEREAQMSLMLSMKRDGFEANPEAGQPLETYVMDNDYELEAQERRSNGGATNREVDELKDDLVRSLRS